MYRAFLKPKSSTFKDVYPGNGKRVNDSTSGLRFADLCMRVCQYMSKCVLVWEFCSGLAWAHSFSLGITLVQHQTA